MKSKTMSARLTRALGRVLAWCRTHRHDPIAEQTKMLGAMVRGHLGYYAVVGNSIAVSRFVHEVRSAWFKWLSRRSNQGAFSWDKFVLILQRLPLPKPRIRWPTLSPR